MGNRISIYPRAHLMVLSSKVNTDRLYDFTTAISKVKGNDQMKLIAGRPMLQVVDYDGSSVINSLDFNEWEV